jgi:Leucine-rich repeat (LRR) protein
MDEDAKIPSALGELRSLQELKIDSTAGEISIPPEIGNLRQLKKFYISKNESLVAIPVSVSKLDHLESVTIRYSPNLIIPDSLLSHVSLTFINITAQGITKIPSVVYHLPKLESLYCLDNKISTVSADLANLTSLRQLNLNLNQIAKFPHIDTLVNLEELELKENRLTKLPPGIEKLKKLKALRISNNLLDDSTTGKIQMLTRLESLDLSNNKLTKLPTGIEKLKNLKYLNLEGNAIDKSTIEPLKQILPNTTIVY